ncbi:MAG: UPF0104 family protein [Planctomycetales bacterium]|nr:UPF0104 family protein [Planctomycetales bacterium]
MAILKAVIIVLVLLGIGRAVSKGWAELAAFRFQWTIQNVLWIAMGGFVYAISLLPLGFYWHRILNRMGQRPTFFNTIRAYYLGHLGKYVPGKAMVVVLRTGALKDSNRAVTAISVFAETLSMMAVGAFQAAAIIAVQFSSHTTLLAASIGLMLVAGVPTFPPVFRFIVLTLKVDKVDEAVNSAIEAYRWPLVIRGWLLSFVAWNVMMLSLWCVLNALEPETVSLIAEYPRLLASVTLAVVAGFLSLLPGGVGVRELVFNSLLSGTYSPAVALVCPVLLRLAWLFAELVTAGVLHAIGRSKSI